MNKLILITALVLSVPVSAWPQNADRVSPVEGYGFVAENAPLGPSAGGGGEVFIYKGFGAGGDFTEAPWSFSQTGMYGNSSMFRNYITSANVYYRVPSKSNDRLEYFVTGGYSIFHSSGGPLTQPNGLNIGIGYNLWLAKHAALRLEFRGIRGGRTVAIHDDPFGWSYITGAQNIFSLRIGVAFR
jgi:hypothetical protein